MSSSSNSNNNNNNNDIVATTEETISAYFVFFSALLTVVLILSKLLHDTKRLSRILPEAGMILLVGMVAGFTVHSLFGDERIGRARGIDNYDYYSSSSSSSSYGASANDDNNNNNNDKAVDYDQLVNNVLSFSPNAFFVVLLPPIIFNSGYHLRRELFFRHIVPIALLAIVGTLVSALVIAFFLKFVTVLGSNGHFHPTFTELLTFGALISATDPVSTLAVFQAKRVDPQLFYLVFGESVLNDAVGLVLFDTFCKFVRLDNGAGKIAMGVVEFVLGFLLDSVASPLLGWICAIGAALLFKHVDFRSHNHKLLELTLFLLIMYVPFLVAEILHLSGIVTILVTGIAARHYVEPNLSESTQDIADVIFRLAAHLAETSIFLELGLSVFAVTQFLQWRFILWSLLACLIARACHVYPITVFFNQSLQNDNPCSLFGYDLRKDIDGIMKMECGEAAGTRTGNSPKNTTEGKTNSNSNNKKRNGRKHKRGNVELREHLNDFSHPDPIERSDSKDSTSSQQSHTSAHQQPQQQQHQKTASSPQDDIPHDDSTATLTPMMKRDMKIQPKTAHMVWFSGLRGAVAYACVRSFPDTFYHQRQFMSTTMVIVLVTVFCMGGATEKMLNALDIEMNVNEDQYMEAWRQSELSPKTGLWTMIDQQFVQRYVIRGYDISASSAPAVDMATNSTIKQDITSSESIDGSRTSNRREGLRRREESSRSTTDGSTIPGIEMTESGHYDTLQEMGIPVPHRRKTSLFDYGLKSD